VHGHLAAATVFYSPQGADMIEMDVGADRQPDLARLDPDFGKTPEKPVSPDSVPTVDQQESVPSGNQERAGISEQYRVNPFSRHGADIT